MIFKFEELEITINGRKFLVDGELELEEDALDEDEIYYSHYTIQRVFDVESETEEELAWGEWKLVDAAIATEFYKTDSTLYNDALAFWEDMQ